MLGTSLLFWGAMTGRPLIGMVAALLVEARHWTRIRWDFDDEDCGRAWQVTSILIAFAAVLIWLDGSRLTALPSLLSWMPVLLLPMQFVQAYGLRDSLPLGIFSFLANHRRKRNLRLGLIDETTHFNFGNVLFTTAMVASAVGRQANTWIFLPGLVALTGWALLAAGRSRRLSLIPALAMAGALAIAGQFGLEHAERWIGKRYSDVGEHFDPNFNNTLIGTRTTVRQSPEIVWRLKTVGSAMAPPLLRTATFTNFRGTDWHNKRRDFTELDSRIIGEDNYYLLQESMTVEDMEKLPSFTLRGTVSEKSPLPLPGDVAGLRGLEQDWVERNSLGTVRIFPKHPVIDGIVFWRGGTTPEAPSLPGEDLQIPPEERETIHDAVANLQLRDSSDLRIKLVVLSTWFQKNFRYTRNLTIKQPSIQERLGLEKPPTAIGRFLTEIRAGHCEYFATAATLMLREAGVPARYTTGYAVTERDAKNGGFLIRGTHGHAWCRVWDQASGTWIDFDPTPPDWISAISGPPTAVQRFNDGLKRLREDFFLWRNQPTHQLGVSLGMAAVGIVLLTYILRRLWRSKRKLESDLQTGDYDGPIVRTPLHAIEIQVRRHLGPRPPGQPFTAWLNRLRPTLPDARLLDEAIALHQRLRFDPAPQSQEHRERLAELSHRLEAALRSG